LDVSDISTDLDVYSVSTNSVIIPPASLNSLQGLTLETLLLFIPATTILIYFEFTGTGSFGHLSFSKNLLLSFAGIATSIPLLFFAAAARKIQLISIGILQYIAPTLQFLIGLIIFKETFSTSRMIGFTFVWIALIIYALNNILKRKKSHISELEVIK